MQISLDLFEPKDEFIVEAMGHDGKFSAIGKVFVQQSLLNDKDLDTIWDLANWEVNGKEKHVVAKGSIYEGMPCYKTGSIVYLKINERIGVVNDNVMVRKHYDVENGYYIQSKRVHPELKKDVWCFGSRSTIVLEYKLNPYICNQNG